MAGRWALVAGAFAAVFAAGFALLITSSAGAAPAPTPPSSTATPGGGLPLDITAGPVKVGVTLPLALDGLLGPTPPATSATSATPTSTPPARTPAPAGRSPSRPYPPTLPTPSISAAPPAGGPANSEAASAPPVRAVDSHRSQAASSTPTRHHSASPSASRTKKRSPGMVFVRSVVPDSAPAFLILLCLGCAIGVAFVVKLSGGRRRL